MATVTLRISPRRAHVRTARLVAAAMARRSGVQEDLLDEIRLAVGEACARAVQLHEQHGVPQPVVIELSDRHCFEVAVRDLVPAAVPVVDPPDDQPLRRTPDTSPPTTRPACGALGSDSDGTEVGGHHGGGTETSAAGLADPARTGPEQHPAVPSRADGADLNHSWTQPLEAGIGLVLLDALVDSIVIEVADPGTRVTMRWPIT